MPSCPSTPVKARPSTLECPEKPLRNPFIRSQRPSRYTLAHIPRLSEPLDFKAIANKTSKPYWCLPAADIMFAEDLKKPTRRFGDLSISSLRRSSPQNVERFIDRVF